MYRENMYKEDKCVWKKKSYKYTKHDHAKIWLIHVYYVRVW